jgi:hypothetical protein
MVKSVGKPDARKGHVRFDERGRETGGCQQAPHRALPRLYQKPYLLAKQATLRNVAALTPGSLMEGGSIHVVVGETWCLAIHPVPAADQALESQRELALRCRENLRGSGLIKAHKALFG